MSGGRDKQATRDAVDITDDSLSPGLLDLDPRPPPEIFDLTPPPPGGVVTGPRPAREGVTPSRPAPSTTPPSAPSPTAPPPPPPPPRSTGPTSPPPEPPPPGRLKILSPLKIRDFAWLWTGLSVSLIGDGIYLVAIAIQVLDLFPANEARAAAALAAVGVAWTVPQLALLVVGGIAADRFDRRRVMMVGDLARAAAMAGVGLLSVTGVLELWHMVVLVAVHGAGEAIFLPAFAAIVPDVVPKNLLVEANSLDQFVRPISLLLVGPVIGGLGIAVFGVGQAFLLNAGTFVFSAVCLMMMSPRPRGRGADHSFQATVREVVEGFRFIKGRAWLWATMVAAALGQLAFFGPYRVLMPIIVEKRLGYGEVALGMVLAAGGVGAIIASVFMGQRGLPRHHITWVYLGWGGATLALAGLGVATALWQVVFVVMGMLALITVGMILWATLLHRLVPGELLGRVASLDWLVSSALLPLSFSLAGILTALVGERATLVGTGVVGCAVMVAFLFVPGVRDIEKKELPTEAHSELVAA